MRRKAFPILEYDGSSDNYILAQNNIEPGAHIPERCVITFFGEALQAIVEKENLKILGQLKLESIIIPIYEWSSSQGGKTALIHGLGGGPYAAGQIEKLVAMGCKQFMICGGCGVLNKGSKVNEIFIPTKALRDEGTSYHYVKPAREIEMAPSIRKKIIAYLSANAIPFRCVKTWTTDAMYRETIDLIKARRQEGCEVVEMECASFFAVAEYKKVSLGQVLYAGDDLSGDIWNGRNWKSQKDFRLSLLLLTLDMNCRF